MPIDTLLSRLERVRPSGPDCWMARCPAHEDQRPSLSLRELDDGRVLLYCYAGCSTADVLDAVGLSLSDLFPEKIGEHVTPERRPFPAADILRSISFECLVVATSGRTLLNGEPFTEEDQERLMLAVERIQAAVDISGVRHG
ncbi:MAG: DNA primase [Betaproteobacteria bacterium]|nr:DNA primase [Betaproteobacteria bacterium]